MQNFIPLNLNLSTLPTSQCWQTLLYFLLLWVWLFYVLHINSHTVFVLLWLAYFPSLMSSRFIPIVINSRISFLFYGHILFIKGIYHIFFVSSSVYGNVHYFHIMATMKNAAMNAGMQIGLWDLVSVLLYLCPKVELIDHGVVLF